jgi:hypothetical protein
MPGTVKLHFYTMPLADALSLIMADKDDLLTLGMSAADVDELLRAARVVVERHAEEVALHYASPSPVERTLRVVQGGFNDDQ